MGTGEGQAGPAGAGGGQAPRAPQVDCEQCGWEVPALEFCVRCGDSLREEKLAAASAARRARQFSAAPEERLAAVRVVSTLFPQLPRAEMDTFRSAFALGVVFMLVLAVAGLFPLALTAAALLVPLLTVLYLYDVDVYEDEPLHVIGLTMLWGAATGAGLALAVRALGVGGAVGLAQAPPALVVRGVVVPLLSGLLMIAGPLLLLPYRRFNDVLDGATFGAASAVSFAGAQLLAQAWAMVPGGLRPGGAVLPWVVRLLELGVAVPLLAAGAIGSAAGAFWLRYRAPVRDRAALGGFGRPAVSAAVAAWLLFAAAAGQLLLGGLGDGLVRLAWVATLAAVSLVWLRRVIHLGLLQSAAEIDIGPDVRCANCRRSTPYHSFCAHCGVSLRALPKVRPRVEPAAQGAGDGP